MKEKIFWNNQIISDIIACDGDQMIDFISCAQLDPRFDLRGVDFRGIDLRNQDLSGIDLTGAKLDGAIIDSTTKFDIRHTVILDEGKTVSDLEKAIFSYVEVFDREVLINKFNEAAIKLNDVYIYYGIDVSITSIINDDASIIRNMAPLEGDHHVVSIKDLNLGLEQAFIGSVRKQVPAALDFDDTYYPIISDIKRKSFNFDQKRLYLIDNFSFNKIPLIVERIREIKDVKDVWIVFESGPSPSLIREVMASFASNERLHFIIESNSSTHAQWIIGLRSLKLSFLEERKNSMITNSALLSIIELELRSYFTINDEFRRFLIKNMSRDDMIISIFKGFKKAISTVMLMPVIVTADHI